MAKSTTAAEPAAVKRLRKLCLRLPEAEETKSFGHVTFRVNKKTFAVFEKYRGEWCFTFKTHPLVQSHLVQDPRFFVAPYVGQHGWTCLSAKAPDWNEIDSLIRESYRMIAPKRLASTVESI